MRKIGLMSDTHSFLDPKVFEYFKDCDEIWHAGDIGVIEVAERLAAFKPFKAVYGNIDENTAVEHQYPLDLRFECEGLRVWITHIGGYPGKYAPRVNKQIANDPPDLFITGHSHILKVMRDPLLNLIHINPGACGIEGWHKVKTLVRFGVENGKIHDLEVIELGRK
jgi:putative phosphoesterase